MKLKMYTMYDVVKAEMGGIMMFKNDAEALRAAENMFQSLDTNPNAVTSREDFKIFRIGEIDTESVRGSLYKKPEHVVITLAKEE